MSEENAQCDLVLLDSVQFIYELSLVELELKALGVDFKIANGLKEFKVLNKSEELIRRIKRKGSYYKTVNGQFTDYYRIVQANRTRSINQYLTHWIYPYKGKFHPQMVRSLLNVIGLKEGDTVLDPFSGSGTTLLEAQLLGINSIGIDISPLCVIQAKVKTESIYALEEIEKIKNEISTSAIVDLFRNRDSYYKFIDDLSSNEIVRNFYKLARLVALSDSSRRGKNFVSSYFKNIALMIDSIKDYIRVKEDLNLKLGNVEIQVGDSRNIKLPNNSVDGIVTSPPYSIALDYIQNDIHSIKDLGCDVSKIRENFIGVRGSGKKKIELYNEDMKESYNEMYRVLKPHSYAAIVIGNAVCHGQEVKTIEFTIKYMENIGFRLVKNINKIIFGLYNIMKNENILLFQKV